jgi:hypothetical protein
MNKKIVALAAMLTMAFSANVFSTENEKKFAASLDIISGLTGAFSGLFQYKLSDHVSLTLPVAVGTHLFRSALIEKMVEGNKDAKGTDWFFNAGLGAHVNVAGKGLVKGFFVEPRVKVGHEKFKLKTSTQNWIDLKSTHVIGSALVGYEWLFDSGLFWSLAVDLGLKYDFKKEQKIDPNIASILNDHSTIKSFLGITDGKSNFHKDLVLAVGYAF